MARSRLVGQGNFRSLIRDLRDGSAEAGVRLAVTVVATLAILAAMMFVLCMIGVIAGEQTQRGGRIWIRVPDDVLTIGLIFAGCLYPAVLYAIWRPHRNKRPMWLGSAITVSIFLVAVFAQIMIDEMCMGDEEALMMAVWCGTFAAIFYVWLQVYRRYGSGRALYGEDEKLDIRCPACEYRMVGLREARCPECGQEYTIDELLSRQDFRALRPRRSALWFDDPGLAGPGGEPEQDHNDKPGVSD